MAKKTSIYLSEDVLSALDLPQSGASESLSGRIGFMSTAAAAVADESCPALTEAEWLFVCDANNGVYHTYELGCSGVLTGVALNCADSPESAERFGVDAIEMMTRLVAMTTAEKLAVFEVVRRFWMRSAKPGEDYAAYLARCGANVAPLYYVSDSRSLETAGPMTLADAEAWLDAACVRHEMEPGDWRHPEYWRGCETPPSLHTEAEWSEMLEDDQD